MAAAHRHPRHVGIVMVGRIMVGVGSLLILVANGLLFKLAATRTPSIPELKVVTLITLVWMLTGAWGMFARKVWGRAMALTVLYIGSVAGFLTIIITLTGPHEGLLYGRLYPFYIATGLYIYVSLVFTNSKHVRRLTSRTWE